MTDTETLEAMIDRHGLTYVLAGLELVCAEKAEHIRVNWQDTALARDWDKAATLLGNTARNHRIAAVDSDARPTAKARLTA